MLFQLQNWVNMVLVCCGYNAASLIFLESLVGHSYGFKRENVNR